MDVCKWSVLTDWTSGEVQLYFMWLNKYINQFFFFLHNHIIFTGLRATVNQLTDKQFHDQVWHLSILISRQIKKINAVELMLSGELLMSVLKRCP